jgi:CubicO group peptidase (beta-lactamase class C family)
MLRKNFQQLILLGLAIFSLLTGFTPGSARDELSSPKINAGAIPLDEEMEDFVDKFLQEKMPLAHIPGLVVVVVKDGNLLFSKGYGFADLGQKTPMTSKTNLRVGSVSKPVLAAAVMQLVEQGLVDPEAPISQYIQTWI